MTVPEQNSQAQPVQDKQKELENNFVAQRKFYEKQLAEQKTLFEQQLQQLQQGKIASDTDYDNDDDRAEDFINRKSFAKELDKRFANVDKKIEQKAEEKARLLVQQERQANFLKQNSDFHQILTEENLQKFVDKHPEIAEPMLEMPDNFARSKLLYQNMKALGIHKPPEQPKPIQQTIDQNRRGPFYQPSGMGAAPYANNGDFSQTGQKAAYDKMMSLIRNRKA